MVERPKAKYSTTNNILAGDNTPTTAVIATITIVT
jgi:hypothetical protein